MRRKLEALFARLFGASVAGKILGASALVAGLSALARLVAVARDLILAAQFGLGPTLDAFFIALMVYQFVIGVFLVAFNGAFMPTYVAVRTNEGEAASNNLLRGVSGLGLLLLVIVTAAVALGVWLYLPIIAPGFNAEQGVLTREIIWLLAPFLVFSGGVTLWGGVINAGQKFALPALTPALNAGISVAALLLFGREFGLGPDSERNRAYMERLTAAGVVASEMEAAHLFVLGAVHHRGSRTAATSPRDRGRGARDDRWRAGDPR